MSDEAVRLEADIAIVRTHTVSTREYMFGRGHTLGILALLSLLMSFDFADRMVIASLIPIIRTDWHISDAQAGLLGSSLYLGMVLFLVPAAVLIDRWSRLKTASLMGVFWSVSSAAGAFTHNVFQLLLTRVGVGLGQAGYAPASYAWIATAVPARRRQLALGLFTAGQPIGMAVGVALGGYIGQHLGWHHALGLMAVPGLFIALALYRGRDYPNVARTAGRADPATSVVQGLRFIIGSRALIFNNLAGAFGTFQWVPVFYFLPTFLHRVHAIPVVTASYLTGAVILISIFSIPLGGWFMDWRSSRRPAAKLTYAWIGSLIGTVLLAIAFGLLRDWVQQYVLVIVATFFLGAVATPQISVTQELVPSYWRALSGSVSILTLHFLGSMPGPFVTGLISDRFGIANALLYIGVGAGLLTVFAFVLARRYYGKDLEKVTAPLEAALGANL